MRGVTTGIYIAASLAWLWVVERQVPTRTDVLGAALATAGALVSDRRIRRSGALTLSIDIRRSSGQLRFPVLAAVPRRIGAHALVRPSRGHLP